MLTIQEIAERLNVGAAKVKQWIERGELPAINVGTAKHRVYRVSEGCFRHCGGPITLPADPDRGPQTPVRMCCWARFSTFRAPK